MVCLLLPCMLLWWWVGDLGKVSLWGLFYNKTTKTTIKTKDETQANNDLCMYMCTSFGPWSRSWSNIRRALRTGAWVGRACISASNKHDYTEKLDNKSNSSLWLTFLVTTCWGRRASNSASSTGDIRPTIKLSLLNPITADNHTPWAWGTIFLYQYSCHVEDHWFSVPESDFSFSPAISWLLLNKPSNAGSIRNKPATSLKWKESRVREQ